MASSSPEADRDLLAAVAREAGALTMTFFGRAPRCWDKPGEAGPVTEADLAADRLLGERLRAARPGYGWLSEETPDDADRLGRDRVFVVDPIDGTRAFIAGEPGWCVAAAVVEAGAPVAAVAFFPVTGALYAAALGAGATRDGAPLACGDRAEAEGATVLAGKPQLDAAHWPGGAPAVRRLFRPSLIHRFCLVAEGAADATLTFRAVWEWDAAAGALIAAEAGCAVSDGDARPLAFNGPSARLPGLIVAPPALHAALAARRVDRAGAAGDAAAQQRGR